MIFGSVCSGIEAASVAWNPLGWRCAFVSEIEKFPCAVLKHHYPEVPNFGDMTKFKDWPDAAIDVLIGGTPCQDLSVAGKRAGLAGEQSGLFHTFVEIVARYKPKYIVWENVPGALSTNEGKDIQVVLDAFTQIGYACDIDILDAQYFGLAQRRRRVFVVCVKLDDLLRQRTPISARIAGELLLQPLLDTWGAIQRAWYQGKLPLDSALPIEPSASSARRKIELLETALGGSACMKLLAVLGGGQVPATAAHNLLASVSRQPNEPRSPASKTAIDGLPSSSTDAVCGGKSIESSWESILAAISIQESARTTSTSIDPIIESAICTFAGQSLSIARSIIDSPVFVGPNPWSADFWNLASLLLTLLEVVTFYARQANSDLFIEASLRDSWGAHLDQAQTLACKSQRNSGNEPSASSLFSLPESLCWNPPPRRKAGQGIARDVAPSLTGSGRGVERPGETRGQDPVVAVAFGGNNTSGPIEATTAVNAHGGPHGRLDFESETFVTHSLRADGFDASEDGTGRGAPLVPVAFQQSSRNEIWLPGGDGSIVGSVTADRGSKHTNAIAFTMKDHGGDAGELSPTLRAGGHSKSHANAGVMPAIAFAQNQRDEVRMMDVAGALAGEPGMKQQTYVQAFHTSGYGGQVDDIAQPLQASDARLSNQVAGIIEQSAVRRLTPVEYTRLQGFPDTYLSQVLYRGKPAADGPMYKALGNSMAIPCVRWLGERIQLVDQLMQARAA